MSDDKAKAEPREWLIWHVALKDRWYAKPVKEGPREVSIRVIEHSAYLKMKERAEKAEAELQKIKITAQRCYAENQAVQER